MTSISTLPSEAALGSGTAISFLNSSIPDSDDLERSPEDSSYSYDDEVEYSDEDDLDISFISEEEIMVNPGRKCYYPSTRVQPKVLQPLSQSSNIKRAEEDARMEEYFALRSAELEQVYQQALVSAQTNNVDRVQPSRVVLNDADSQSDSDYSDEELGEDQSIIDDAGPVDLELDHAITGWVKDISLSRRSLRN